MSVEVIDKLKQKNNGNFKLVDLDDIDYDGTGKNAKEALQTLIGQCVQKEAGKGLSTNDYTAAEKEKLSALKNYDDTEIKANINNKADKSTTDNIQTQVNNLVLGAVGDGNNAEVIQARGEHDLLNDRLLEMDSETEKIKKIVSWTTQFIDRGSLIANSYYTISNNQVINATANSYRRHPELSLKSGTYKISGFSTGFTIIKNKSDSTLKKLSEFISDKNTEYGEHSITIDYDFIIYPTTNRTPMMIDGNYFPSSYVYGTYDFDFDGIRVKILDNTVTQNMRDIATLKETLNTQGEVNLTVPTDYSTIQEALNSITDSSKNKIYNIYIEDGTYNFKMIDSFVPNYVNFIGKSGNRDKCVIKV